MARRLLWRGTIDRIVDYGHEGLDGSHRQLVIYYRGLGYGRPGVIVTSARITTSDFEYVQELDQWRSEFQGNSAVAMFYYNPTRRRLVPFNEAPFCFYDLRGDASPQIAVRLEIPQRFAWARSHLLLPRYLFERFGGVEPVQTARYSFAVDPTPSGGSAYNYVFSVTAVGVLQASASATTRLRLGAMETEPFVACARAREAVENTEWTSLALTWVEDALNYAVNDPERHSRWEGVINRGSELFPQVGGPPSRPINTRTEVATERPRRIDFYYSTVDRRIHLLGARVGWLRIDYDLDGRIDMQSRYEDTNGDGVFDRWETDVDGDGVYDRVYVAPPGHAMVLGADYERVTSSYREARRRTILEYELTLRRIKSVLGPGPELPVEPYDFGTARPGDELGKGQRANLEAWRLYLGVMLELYFRDLRRWAARNRVPPNELETVTQLFGAGRYDEMGSVLERWRRER